MKLNIEMMQLFAPWLLVGLIVITALVNNLIIVVWGLSNPSNYMQISVALCVSTKSSIISNIFLY